MPFLLFITFLFSVTPSALAMDNAMTPSPAFAALPVTFVVQAPFGDWSWPWQDFCEEASVLMAMAYIQGRDLALKEKANELLELSKFELKTLGREKDTNLKDTEWMIRGYYQHSLTKIIENPGVEDIKREIQNGNPVLFPLAGRELHNPHFVSPPRYHMAVVTGFADTHFIVQEPGTRFGENFQYEISQLMSAIHDFIPEGDITKAPARVLVVLKNPPSPSPAAAIAVEDNAAPSPRHRLFVLSLVVFPFSVLGWL